MDVSFKGASLQQSSVVCIASHEKTHTPWRIPWQFLSSPAIQINTELSGRNLSAWLTMRSIKAVTVDLLEFDQ